MKSPAAGDVIDAKYRLLAPMGSGGMGVVWRAEHLALRSLVAVKLMHRRIAGAAAIERFQREARAAAALRSPHVVGVIDSGIAGDTPYVVMELLEGEALDQRLRRMGRLDFEQTVRIVSQVARALARAHEAGIVHRDLKPANVFLQHNADEELVKVLDFGVAKLSPVEGVSPLTHTGAVLGSPHYMSPEQARGRRDVDHRTDCWALAIIAFECITARRPFDSEVMGDLLLKICTDPAPVPSQFAAVPAGFDAWFEKAVERDPDRRFQSATELAEALRTLQAPRVVPSAVPAPGPVQRSSSPLPMLLAAGGLLAVLGLVLAGVLGLYAFGVFSGAAGSGSQPAASAPGPHDAGAEVADDDAASATMASASSAPSASGSAAPAAVKTSANKGTPTATATAKPPASGNDACVRACNKIRACAPGANCDSSGACTGLKRVLADCVNRTACEKIADECLP